MKRGLRILFALFLILLAMVILGCQGQTPAPAGGGEAIQPPAPPAGEDEVLPGEDAPGGDQPTAGAVSESGWMTTASTRTELSYGFPGDWIGPAQLPFGDGYYIKHPDKDVGMIIVLNLQGDITDLALAWSQAPYEIVGLVTIEGNPLPLTDSISISRLQGQPVGVEGDLRAQAIFVQRPDDIMQLILYTPAEEWAGWQETFERILGSMEVWNKVALSEMQTMILHDWKGPMVNWEQDGFWAMSEDLSAGMVVFTGPIADPVQALAGWTPDRLATLEFAGCVVEDGDGMSGLGGEWESRIGTCSGGQSTFEVAMMANRDRVLEVITYASTDTWEYHTAIFATMLEMLIDLRP